LRLNWWGNFSGQNDALELAVFLRPRNHAAARALARRRGGRMFNRAERHAPQPQGHRAMNGGATANKVCFRGRGRKPGQKNDALESQWRFFYDRAITPRRAR